MIFWCGVYNRLENSNAVQNKKYYHEECKDDNKNINFKSKRMYSKEFESKIKRYVGNGNISPQQRKELHEEAENIKSMTKNWILSSTDISIWHNTRCWITPRHIV